MLFIFLGLLNSNSNFENSFNLSPPLPTSIHPYLEGNRHNVSHRNYFNTGLIPKKDNININYHDVLQILIIVSGVFALLCLSYINLFTRVSYVTFNTDLNIYNKKKTLALPQYIWIFHLVSLGLLLSECEKVVILIIISRNIEFGIVLVFVIKFRRIISRTIFGSLLIYIFAIANTPATCTLCLMVFQMWCYSCVKFWRIG